MADVNRSSGLLFVALFGRNAGTEDSLRPLINTSCLKSLIIKLKR